MMKTPGAVLVSVNFAIFGASAGVTRWFGGKRSRFPERMIIHRGVFGAVSVIGSFRLSSPDTVITHGSPELLRAQKSTAAFRPVDEAAWLHFPAQTVRCVTAEYNDEAMITKMKRVRIGDSLLEKY
jgi:hypothetical protein